MNCFVVTPHGNTLHMRGARRRPSLLEIIYLEAALVAAYRVLACCLCGVEHSAW